VTSIGAGGGSIAWVDELGVLKVGPESAGSSPGPACYGRGGERPTITDAFVVLGYIGQFDLGYNAIGIDTDRARAAVATVAQPMNLAVERAAEAIIDIAVSGMYMEVSKLISRYAVDPRDFALQAFGGAGPMMACFLAKELAMTNVVIPPTPGVLSALGGLIADIKNDFIRTVFLDLDEDVMPEVLAGFAQLKREAVHWLRNEQGYEGEYQLVHSADMRYRGQSFEIECVFDSADVDGGSVYGMADSFHREHERVYEHADREAAVQIINLRLVIAGMSPKPQFPKSELVQGDAVAESNIEVFIAGEIRSVPLYARESMSPGQRFTTPCVVAQSDCTTCVPDGLSGRVDAYGNLILTLEATH